MHRINTEERSIGELFLSMVEEIKDAAFDNPLELILYLFIDNLPQMVRERAIFILAAQSSHPSLASK